jgi:hypothetical protein
MIILKEKQLTEGADIPKIQKQVVANIFQAYVKDKGMGAQKSSNKKVCLGECLGALTSVATILNPLGDYYPELDSPNTPLDKDVQALYKELLTLIKDFQTVYTKDYGDNLR